MITGSGSTAIQQRFSYDAAGNLVAVVYKVGSGTSYIYYYLSNAQGDIVKLIDSSGNTVVEYTYDSWGKIIATTGSLANTVGANQPFRYRGYVYDEETGWYYLQSRCYDPTTCRFISADVLLSTGQGIVGHNSYSYCLNNPNAFIDEEGSFATLAIGEVTITFTQIFVLAVCICFVLDLLINQDQSLVSRLVDALRTMVIDSIDTIKALWNNIMLSKKPRQTQTHMLGQAKRNKEEN
jgi:RHS repeat-associated protein